MKSRSGDGDGIYQHKEQGYYSFHNEIKVTRNRATIKIRVILTKSLEPAQNWQEKAVACDNNHGWS